METLLVDNALRNELGTNARGLARSYDMESFGRAVAKVYAYVLKGRRHGKRMPSAGTTSAEQDAEPPLTGKQQDIEL